MNDIAIHHNGTAPATAEQVRGHVNLIQQVMRAVMQRDVHFGVIPGTDKPTLYKAGAETLAAVFHIAPSYDVIDLNINGASRYRVTCKGTHQGTGLLLGTGVGSCSSLEEKYKWRRSSSQKEYDATPDALRRIRYGYNKEQRKEFEIRQVRVDPADIDNTILKMACKRAFIAMILNCTAASDIFTQDIEDLPPELRALTEEDKRVDVDERKTRLLKLVAEAKTLAELQSIWKAGVSECMGAQDRVAADAFKDATVKRTEELNASAAKQKGQEP